MSRRLRRLLGAGVLAAISVGAGCAGSDPTDGGDASDGRVRLAYGDHEDAFGELWLPVVEAPAPVVVLIHGGFWRDGFLLDLMDPLIPSLLDRGIAVWNVEYRRVGAGGGFPETFLDVADAIDHLARLPASITASLDLSRVGVVGHSAGGHLAAWVAARSTLAAGEVGAGPAIRPGVVVSQAGVLDLVGCALQGVGGSACIDVVGADPIADPDRYAVTSPTEMVPFDATVVAVHGGRDRIVPSSQSTTFVDRATSAGMDARYLAIRGADHFSNLDPEHPAWTAVLEALDRSL